MSRKALALKNFKSQLDAVEGLTYQTSRGWKSYTRDIITNFIGPNSKFLVHYTGALSYFTNEQFFERDKLRSREIITQCIRYIEMNGAYKDPNSNFVSRMSETALWSILSVGVTGLLSAGFYFGNLSSDKQNIELRQEVKVLKDSLSLLRLSIKSANKIPNSRADTVHEDSVSKINKK